MNIINLIPIGICILVLAAILFRVFIRRREQQYQKPVKDAPLVFFKRTESELSEKKDEPKELRTCLECCRDTHRRRKTIRLLNLWKMFVLCIEDV